ncbi:MAG: hypothetical protein KJ964_13935 [Verrucomicrobia bacterium]|nr:hypothetical protein [Verrucomicrobiota bacterium]MBU1734741.1 hypothetical protein [Verrucomicrobiota bacterium]MBU1857759.1 hypothetical protein [Verrucomicrobiota bacterium]
MTTNAAGPHQEQYDPQKYRLKLFPVILAVAIFYISAILLNANGIMRDIELMQYGKFRDVYLSAFSPIAGFSNRLGLTKFRTIIEKSIGDRMHNEKIKP